MNHLENPSTMPLVDLSPIITSDAFVDAQEFLSVSTDLGSFFDTVGDYSSAYINTNRRNLFPFVDPKKADVILDSQDFSGVSPTDSEYEDLLTVARSKERLNRKLIKEVVRGENNLGLTDVEKTVLLASCDLADGFDELYYQWRRAVVLGPVKGLKDAVGKEEAKRALKDKGAIIDERNSYQYVVYTENEDGTYNTLTYAEAFPDEVATISDRIGILVEDLSQQEPDGEEQTIELDALITYFGSYRRALLSTNPEEHEDLYRKLDEEWMAIRGRMQPLHMMEVYRDPLGLSVEPEYALAFIDQRFPGIEVYATFTKRRLIESLKRDFSGLKSLNASITAMEESMGGAYTFLISGRRVDFRPAGQNIPNREEVKLGKGVKFFIDTKTVLQRWLVQKQLLEKVFGKEAFDRDFTDDQKIIDISSGVFLVGHEISHNAFIMEGTRAKIGPSTYKSIEENKSDLSIITSIRDVLSPDEQRVFIQGLVGTMFRSLTRLNDSSGEPYVNSAYCILNAMVEAGMLRFDGERWELNNTEGHMNSFLTVLNEVFVELVNVYDSQNTEKAKEFMERHYSPSSAVISLVELVNSH